MMGFFTILPFSLFHYLLLIPFSPCYLLHSLALFLSSSFSPSLFYSLSSSLVSCLFHSLFFSSLSSCRVLASLLRSEAAGGVMPSCLLGRMALGGRWWREIEREVGIGSLWCFLSISLSLSFSQSFCIFRSIFFLFHTLGLLLTPSLAHWAHTG